MRIFLLSLVSLLFIGCLSSGSSESQNESQGTQGEDSGGGSEDSTANSPDEDSSLPSKSFTSTSLWYHNNRGYEIPYIPGTGLMGDANGDGNENIIVGYVDSGKVHKKLVILDAQTGQKLKTFNAPGLSGTPWINGVVTFGDGTFAVLNQSNGIWLADFDGYGLVINAGMDTTPSTFISLGDFDNNGVSDMAITGSTSDGSGGNIYHIKIFDTDRNLVNETSLIGTDCDRFYGLRATTDHNGDNINDLLVNCGSSNSLSNDRWRVVSGADFSVIHRIVGDTADPIEDVDGDGKKDLYVTQRLYSAPGSSRVGGIETQLVSGQDFSVIRRRSLDESVIGKAFPTSVVDLGDLDGDGFNDYGWRRTAYGYAAIDGETLERIGIRPFGDGPSYPAGDLDGDGKDDFFIHTRDFRAFSLSSE